VIPQPSLTTAGSTSTRRGLILVLHGGREWSRRPVGRRSLSWQRARWLMRDLTPSARAASVGIRLLGYRRAEWNNAAPVGDARWALDRIREEPGAPSVVLLGHSMGARVAMRVAGVVGLAPWLPEGEPATALAGKQLVAAHGRRDRITSYAGTVDFVRRAAPRLSPPRRISSTWTTSVTTCSPAAGAGTTSPAHRRSACWSTLDEKRDRWTRINGRTTPPTRSTGREIDLGRQDRRTRGTDTGRVHRRWPASTAATPGEAKVARSVAARAYPTWRPAAS
jgi:hypothetical protein